MNPVRQYHGISHEKLLEFTIRTVRLLNQLQTHPFAQIGNQPLFVFGQLLCELNFR